MSDLVDRMLRAIKTRSDIEILQFGDFKVTRKLGRGQQGMVVLAQNPNGKMYAIKFYSPSEGDPTIVRKGKERFIREVKILLELRHRNIVSVHMAGSARWDKSQKRWIISTDFVESDPIFYYVMDYIKGKSVKSLFYKKFNKKTHKYEINPQKGTQFNLDLFEQLITQVSGAMTFFHKRGVVHRDIKPDNIIYSAHDNSFTIVDFGFARHFQKGISPSYQEIMLRKAYFDSESERQGMVDHLTDQYAFAKMLLEILRLFKSLYMSHNYYGIKSSLMQASAEHRNERYKNMSEFKEAIEPHLYLYPYRDFSFQNGTFLVSLTRFGNFDSRLRIPFSGSIPLFREVRDIIDKAEFQRLRGVCQLGPTQFVYPGATHTRFEHSLGTYFLSLKYLQVLLKNPSFYQAADPVDEAIKLVVLGALLHDIGHYPYSHWIEEITGLPNERSFSRHEDRACNIICKSEIGEIIKSEWGVDPEQVCRLISGSGRLTQREELLRSIIDSDIDVDKIDYLQRDSAHCGVPYGRSFDVERLISSLWINKEHNKICLTEKGRSSFAALIMSNIVMYQEVYWHKTVRACTAMFKRFFYEVLDRRIVNIKTLKRRYLLYPDQRFIETLAVEAKDNEELSTLIRPFSNRGRYLFKPAYVHYHGHALYTKHESTKEFFNLLATSDYPTNVKMARTLVEGLKSLIHGINECDILLETTPVARREVAELVGFQFYDSKQGEYEDVTAEIRSLNDYLKSNRRSYVFCNPKYLGELRGLLRNGKLNEVLGDVIENIRNR